MESLGNCSNKLSVEDFDDDCLIDKSFENEWLDDEILEFSTVENEFSSSSSYKSPVCISTIPDQFTSAYTDSTDYQNDQNKSVLDSQSPICSLYSEEPSQACSSVDLEWEDDSQVHAKVDTSKATAKNETWRTVVISGKNYKLDMNIIQPYRQVLSHGGYHGDGLNAIVVFSACFLPSTKMSNSRYILDNLFLYIVSTLDLLVAHEYLIVFFSSGCTQNNRPPIGWLKKCYKLIDKRLKKNLKNLIIVHPSWHIRLIIKFFKPFLSSKFSKKITFVHNLHSLADVLPIDNIIIPKVVQDHDLNLIDKNFNSSKGSMK